MRERKPLAEEKVGKEDREATIWERVRKEERESVGKRDF